MKIAVVMTGAGMSTIAQNVPAVPVAVPMNVIAVNVSSSSSSSEQHDEHLQKERYMEHKHAISMSSAADMPSQCDLDTDMPSHIKPMVFPNTSKINPIVPKGNQLRSLALPLAPVCRCLPCKLCLHLFCPPQIQATVVVTTPVACPCCCPARQ